MARNTNYKNSKAREAKAPSFIAYHVAERGDDKTFWTRIGAAFSHQDGKGFTLDLNLVPVDSGRIVLRVRDEEQEKGA